MAKLRVLADRNNILGAPDLDQLRNDFKTNFYNSINNSAALGYFQTIAPVLYYNLYLLHDANYSLYVVKNSGKVADEIVKKYGAGNTQLANTIAATYIQKGLTVALNLVPGVGNILSGLLLGLNSFLGFNIFAIETFNRSLLANNRLGDYAKNFFRDANPFNIPDPYRMQIFYKLEDLIHVRPKCMALTNACSNEHGEFIARTDLMRKAADLFGAINQRILQGDELSIMKQYYITDPANANNLIGSNSAIGGVIAGIVAGLIFS